ncbi:PIN domain-containing protein (plasmid) [Micromonospora sp. CA-248260]|uniref:PIN domain-containing protein n=1 Tax=Micromonospora sp. CA-248260 TaxID=3239962 RepID=UPI003D8F4E1B
MLITPVPGVNAETLRWTLTNVRNSLTKVQPSGPERAAERACRYLEWVHEARRLLRGQIRPAELEYLLPSQDYEVVLAAIAAHAASNHLASERVFNGLIATQLDERGGAFDAALSDLDKQIKRFQQQRDAELVVLDTNIYMHHPQKLGDIDLAGELRLGNADIHILVPLVVIDELDKGKRAGGDRGYRAAYAVSYIDKIAQAGGRIHAGHSSSEGHPRGKVTVEVVLDPPGHARLPNNDDEIVARAVDIQTLAGRPIRLVTYDVKMRMRGRDAGLRVDKLEEPEKDEKPSRRRRRDAD